VRRKTETGGTLPQIKRQVNVPSGSCEEIDGGFRSTIAESTNVRTLKV
jgi:hypothetical protein